MSDATRQFFEELKSGQEVTPLQAVKEGIQAIAPGLNFDSILNDVKGELGRQAILGQAELANALFNGQAYTQYGDGQRGQEVLKDQPAMEQPQQQQERDGRSM